jgi:hypothetical protein
MSNDIPQELPKKDLTIKQRKWIRLYIDTGNATEAAMQVYDCKDRDVARSIGSENLAKLDYSAFLEEAGITDKLLQQKIMEGLDATRTVSAIKTSKNATADSTDFVDVPDFLTRHKYLETALKLKKRLLDKPLNDNLPDINFDLYGNTIIQVNQSTTQTG